ncbi:MAG: ROK family protein [Acidimicrobiales bacterium]|nr:ROK family protein [Acidimicrobiales bacterium]
MSRVVCGLDLGGTKLLGVVVDPSSDAPMVVLKRPRPDHVVAGMASMVEELKASAREVDPAAEVTAVGVGMPGLVDRAGVFRYGPNLKGVVDVGIAEAVADAVGLPVVVDNDATCAGWAEHERGAARGANHSLTVTLGTGIGAGLTVKGQVLRGAHGFAGEPGHMMIEPSGHLCRCGRLGCWEQYASGFALGRMGREAAEQGRAGALVALAGGDLAAIEGEHVTAAAADGDADSLAVIGQFSWWVAQGLANLVNVLDSEVVVIGGGLAEVGELIIDPIRRAFDGVIMGADHRDEVPIVAAQLGERAGAWGAALLASART